ncbi:cysteine-rich KTR domain-containing protein [Enterococcus avium]|uniref:cysteine-rich KTR domain-containing protein n=1 Tax=Enterococcus avium TaxID=33945 RepID=UPI0032E40140
MVLKWIRCPLCGNKTRTKVQDNTILVNFPLFCPKCKREVLINVDSLKITIIREPDAKTQSQ